MLVIDTQIAQLHHAGTLDALHELMLLQKALEGLIELAFLDAVGRHLDHDELRSRLALGQVERRRAQLELRRLSALPEIPQKAERREREREAEQQLRRDVDEDRAHGGLTEGPH